MNQPITKNIQVNKDNDLMFRTSGLSEEEKKKLQEEQSINESSGSDGSNNKLEYFTD